MYSHYPWYNFRQEVSTSTAVTTTVTDARQSPRLAGARPTSRAKCRDAFWDAIPEATRLREIYEKAKADLEAEEEIITIVG